MKRIFLILFLMPIMFSTAYAEEIGTVTKLQTYAYGTKVGESKKPLYAHDDVYANQTIQTAVDSVIQIIFKDDTEFFMGEGGSIILDKFVYDTNNDDLMVVTLATGLFRFISGKIAKENVVIKSPVAIIGIRGTDVEITVDNSGITTATAFKGAISVNAVHVDIVTDGCQTIIIAPDGSLLSLGPCPSSGPSIGTFSFTLGRSDDENRNGTIPRTSSNADSPSVGVVDDPSDGPGNGNGNAGNPGNGGGNVNGNGPGTGNGGQNNGQGGGAGNGGGGKGNSGHK